MSESPETMEQYLLSQGWVKGPEEGIPIWHPADSPAYGASLHAAYVFAKNDEAERNRKAGESEQVAIYCNKCGEALARYAENTSGKRFFVGYYGLVNTEYKTGYYSEHLPDGQRYIFSLCEKCIADLIKTFKTPPEVEFEL